MMPAATARILFPSQNDPQVWFLRAACDEHQRRVGAQLEQLGLTGALRDVEHAMGVECQLCVELGAVTAAGTHPSGGEGGDWPGGEHPK